MDYEYSSGSNRDVSLFMAERAVAELMHVQVRATSVGLGLLRVCFFIVHLQFHSDIVFHDHSVYVRTSTPQKHTAYVALQNSNIMSNHEKQMS